MVLLIDSLGAPASHKSKTMLDLVSWLKSYFSYYKLPTVIEYCSEYVKDAVWEKDQYTIGNQAIVFGQQFRNIERLINNKVDIICSDSGLLLSAIYANKNRFPQDHFIEIIKSHYTHITGKVLPIYFKIDQERYYINQGRFQDKEESNNLNKQIYEISKKIFENDLIEIIGNNQAVFKIIEILLNRNLIPTPNFEITDKLIFFREFVKEYIERNLCLI